jgi:hypothetical protein
MSETKTKLRAWRPRKPDVRYSKAVTEAICEGLMRGETWGRICQQPGMPSYRSLYVWQKRHPEFAEAVAVARVASADLLADRALEVAQAATKETVQQDRLLVTTLMKQSQSADRKWGGGQAAAQPDPPQAPQKRVIFYVRQFERVTGPDGKTYIREIPRLPSAAEDGR